MKRTMMILLSLLLVMTALSGCGDAGNGGAGNDSNSGDADGQSTYDITYAGTVPDSHPMMRAMNLVADEMREESGGRLNMSVFPNNTLGDSRSNIESMQGNSIQVGEVSSAPLAGFTANYVALNLPFLFENREQAFAFMETEFAEELAEKTAAEIGVRPVAWFENGARTVTNSRRAVESPEDMKGLKIRVMENPVFIRTFEAMGAAATPMSFAEVFTGLQQKTIDGQDNPLAITVSNKFYEVQGYFTDLHHTIDMAPILISETFYQELPDELREMFTRYMLKAAEYERELMAEEDADYLATVSANSDVTLLTNEQRAVFKEACDPVYDWFVAEYADVDLQRFLNVIAGL